MTAISGKSRLSKKVFTSITESQESGPSSGNHHKHHQRERERERERDHLQIDKQHGKV
jgi:hypothetical protein